MTADARTGGPGVATYTSSRLRFAVSGLLGVATGVVLGVVTGWQVAVLGAWDVAAAVQLTWIWTTVGRWDADLTASHATCEDSSRDSTRIALLGASVASLGGVALALTQRTQGSAFHTVVVAMGMATVALSWGLVHTLYALHYAHLFYTPPVGGIDFKTDQAPAYADFAYVAFTVGMTFQVSDTDVQDRALRHAVLMHALLAYLLGAVIVAVSVNLVASGFQ